MGCEVGRCGGVVGNFSHSDVSTSIIHAKSYAVCDSNGAHC